MTDYLQIGYTHFFIVWASFLAKINWQNVYQFGGGGLPKLWLGPQRAFIEYN